MSFAPSPLSRAEVYQGSQDISGVDSDQDESLRAEGGSEFIDNLSESIGSSVSDRRSHKLVWMVIRPRF